MKCPNCETENRESAKFCDECGFPLSGAILKATLTGGIGVQKPIEDKPEEGDSPEGEIADNDLAENGVGENPTEAIGSIASEDPFEDLADEYPSTDAGIEDEGVSDTDMTIALGDLGFDADDGESLVGDDYVAPEANWRDGHTMKMEPVEGDSEPKRRDFLASATAKKNPRRKKIAIIAIIIAAVAIIAIGATYALELWGGKTIPDVTGLTEAEATAMLSEEGFAVKPLQVKSDDTEGLVLVMDPSAGSRAEKGSEIMIHVATARLIPDIIGKTKDQAAKLLEESGFTNVTYAEERSSRPLGEVISVSPEVGKRTKSGDAVTVTTAKPYTVPDISNMYLSDAEAAIEGEGLVPSVEYVYTEDYDDGIIMGTNPPAGTEVQEGSTVSIQIARSREAECIALTQSYLAPGSSINVGLYGYEIESIDSLTYMGDSIVAYSITARPFITGFGETAYFSSQPLAGQIEWTASNTIASMT